MTILQNKSKLQRPNLNNWINSKGLTTANKGSIDFVALSPHTVGRYWVDHRLYNTARSVPYSIPAIDSLRRSGEIQVPVQIICGDQLLAA